MFVDHSSINRWAIRFLPWLEKVFRTRVGTPDDIAGAILYLASEYGGYITGETLHVSGGRYAS